MLAYIYKSIVMYTMMVKRNLSAEDRAERFRSSIFQDGNPDAVSQLGFLVSAKKNRFGRHGTCESNCGHAVSI